LPATANRISHIDRSGGFRRRWRARPVHAHRDGGQSIVLWNDGNGHFPTSTKVGAAKAWIRMGAAGDLDGDGRPDLAIIDERLKATFIILNRGGRQFGEWSGFPAPSGRHTAWRSPT
jgi:hypothetical protein